MIRCYGYTDDVVQSYEQLIEATVAHGRDVAALTWEKLPEKTRQTLIDQAKAQGYGEGYARYVLAPRTFTEKSQMDSGVMITEPVTFIHGDVYSGAINKGIEKYDRDTDEEILLSENIVEAYNASINGKFEEAKKLVFDVVDIMKRAQAGHAPTQQEIETANKLTDVRFFDINVVAKLIAALCDVKDAWKLTEEDIKRLVCDAFYQPSEDPEEIKQIVNARITYNNLMIQLFRGMLERNYRILGITKEEADLLIAQLDSDNSKSQNDAMVKIRSAIVDKSSVYMIGKKSFDLRPLGAGIYLETDEVTNLERHTTPDRVMQSVMEYDCVIMAHGGNTSEKGSKFLKNYNQQASDVVTKFKSDDQQLMTDIDNDPNYNKEYLRQDDEVRRREVSSDKGHKVQLKLDKLKKEYKDCEIRIKLLESRLKDYDQEVDQCWDELRAVRISGTKRDLMEADRKLSAARKKRDEVDSELLELMDKRVDLNRQMLNAQKILQGYEKYGRSNDDYVSRSRRILSRRDATVEGNKRAQKRYDTEARKNGRWTMQPIKAPNGQTYTVMDDLVLAMINMGCKSFLIMSCNPGNHTLSPEILSKPGVSIRYGQYSVVSENQYTFGYLGDPDNDPYYDIETTLCEVENDLSAICGRIDLDYLDDTAINEAAQPAADIDTFMNEGALANIWKALVKIIKSAIAMLVKLFKAIVNFIKKLISSIKNFFSKLFRRSDGNKFSKSIHSATVMIEDAHVDSYQANSWREVQNALLRSCDAISKKIKQTEDIQMQNMELMKRYSEEKSRTIQESANPTYDHIISLLM